jgi:phosphoglycolate phosphatase-like HAD superfamily hydrolase
VKVLLFDIDGTLIYTGGAGKRAFVETLREAFGIEDTLEDIPFSGKTDPLIIREIFAKHEIEPSAGHFDLFLSRYVGCLQRLIADPRGIVMPGIREILETCFESPRFLLGLLTGNIRRGAEIKLHHYRLYHYFSFGAFGDDHEDRTELARIAHERSRRQSSRDFRPEDLYVIGDTPRDIECGRAIGARTVAVATGKYSREELAQHQPDFGFADLADTKVFFDRVLL